jgi:ribosomal protein L11 methyltransferase
MADRLIRVRAPEPVRLRDLDDLLAAAGALEIAHAPGELVARFAPDEPRYLEDRLEVWLHLVDRAGAATLESARGGGPWTPGWQAVYSGADVAGFKLRPPWATLEGGEIVIDPRGGFGSGLHPSTGIALALLRNAQGASALDVGSGSGVLSIAAARRGMNVTAIELEEGARHLTRGNAERNGAQVRVLDAALDELDERFDLVLANMPGGILGKLSAQLLARVSPGGSIILSGTLRDELDPLLARFGLPVRERMVSSDGEWAGATLSP